MKRPVLLSGHTLQARAVLEAVKCSFKLPDEGLASVSMTLAPGAARVEIGDWLRVTTPQGKRMVMAVTATGTDTDSGDAQTVEAEHVFALLRDSQCDEINADQADMTAADAIRAMLGCQKEPLWQLGTCEYTDALPWAFRRQSIHDGLETVTGCLDDPRWELDTDAMPFTMHLLRHSGAPACEMRMARNMATLRVRRERTGMATRVIPVGMDDLGIESENGGAPYIEKKADRYGIIEQTIINPAIDNARVLKAWGEAQLDKCCQPIVTISITGRELSARTGLAMDRLTVGTVCRVAARGGPIIARIAQLEWRDAIAQPESVAVTLSTKRRTMQSVVRRLQTEAAETKRGGGGSGAKQQKTNQEIWTSISQTQEEIKLEAYRLDKRIDGNAENYARLSVRADEIGAEVQRVSDRTDENAQEYARLSVRADEIEAYVSRVEEKGDDNTLGIARLEITAESITQSVEAVKITADGNEKAIAQLKVTADSVESVVTKYGYDSAGALLEAHTSQIRQTEEDILLRVLKTDYNGKTIASLINIGTNDILIRADRINLDGYVTASELSAEIANLQVTDSSILRTGSLSAKNFIQCDGNFYLGSNRMYPKSMDVVVSVGGRATGAIAVRDASGSIIGSALTGYSVSYRTETIDYFGY